MDRNELHAAQRFVESLLQTSAPPEAQSALIQRLVRLEAVLRRIHGVFVDLCIQQEQTSAEVARLRERLQALEAQLAHR